MDGKGKHSMLTATMVTINKMVEALPEVIQERIADHLSEYIADLKDEMKWDDLFKKTQPQMSTVAKKVRKEIKKGKAAPFDYERL